MEASIPLRDQKDPNSSSKVDYGSTKTLKAREAFMERSKELCIEAHNMGEDHVEVGGAIKALVYGGLDGIITTFATVTTVAGANLSSAVILILGVAHLFADGISMGLGDYMGSKAEEDLIKRERAREEWEFKENPEGEIKEMVDLYVGKGIAKKDAEDIMRILSKYEQAFIDIMMIEELNLNPNEEDEALYSATITFVSFAAFGSIPLLSYLAAIIPGVEISSDEQFYASVVLTGITMFILGAIKGRLVNQNWLFSGFTMMSTGFVAAFCGWIIGYGLSRAGFSEPH